MDLLFKSNINRSINKEIKRDINLLRSDLWLMGFNQGDKKYETDTDSCIDIEDKIINLPNWEIDESRPNLNSPLPPDSNDPKIQYWWPDERRGKIFKGRTILLIRILKVKSFNNNENLDNSISNINYIVKWNDNNIQWLSIDLGSEAHSWCF